MENQARPLVSAPATPPNYPSFESDGTEGQASVFTLPTPQQQSAINELKDCSEQRILAWLAFVRSLEHGYRYRSAAGGLSCQQVSAISVLKDCSDSDIVIWLQYVALAGNVNLRQGVSRSTSKSSAGRSPRHTWRSSPRSAPRSSTNSLAPSIYSTSTSFSTPRSSVGYASSLSDLPEAASESESLGHVHWCPECGKDINSCDGWKRHMKEHETYYPCMPDGPIEYHCNTPTCALCGIPYPSREHLAEHHVALCISGSKTPTRKSRKSLMTSHLAQHGILDAGAASALADKWQCKRNKRAFSCGFCVSSFSTIMEQLNHIDNEHFKHGQDKSSWDTNIVIQGLLHQPKVYKHWWRLLLSDPALVESKFRWESPAAETLQTQLEIGDESGSDLALTAFGNATYECGTVRPNVSTAITIPVLQHMVADPYSSVNGLRTTSAQILEVPTHQVNSVNSTESLPAPQIQTGIPSWSDFNNFPAHLHPPNPSHIPDQPVVHRDSFAYDNPAIQSPSQEALAFEDNYNLDDNKPTLSSLPNGCQSLETSSHLNYRARLQNFHRGNDLLNETHMSYPPFENTAFISSTDSIHFPANPQSADYETFNNGAIMSPRLPAPELRSQASKSNSHEKPLPALPVANGTSETQDTESRPLSPPRPMDLDTS